MIREWYQDPITEEVLGRSLGILMEAAPLQTIISSPHPAQQYLQIYKMDMVVFRVEK
jgi:hypothetical protein